MSEYKGIDLSRYNGAPDFQQVRDSGIQFVILQAGYGQNHLDAQFQRSIRACNQLELPVGVYWFSYALTPEDAAREAQFCIDAVKEYRVELPVCYDLEYDSVRWAAQQGVTIDRELASAMAAAFCAKVEQLGYYAMLYANADYLERMFQPELLERYALWYASYQSTCDRSDAGIWQHSDTGRVDGIEGNVDLDISFRDYPALIRSMGLNGLKKEAEEYPQWQTEGLQILADAGIVTAPDYWLSRFGTNMTVGECFGALGALYRKLKE